MCCPPGMAGCCHVCATANRLDADAVGTLQCFAAGQRLQQRHVAGNSGGVRTRCSLYRCSLSWPPAAVHEALEAPRRCALSQTASTTVLIAHLSDLRRQPTGSTSGAVR